MQWCRENRRKSWKTDYEWEMFLSRTFVWYLVESSFVMVISISSEAPHLILAKPNLDSRGNKKGRN